MDKKNPGPDTRTGKYLLELSIRVTSGLTPVSQI